jgi:hypothetical protein
VSTTAAVVQAAEIGLTLVMPTLVFGVIVHAGRIASALAALARRLRLLPDPVPIPVEPPIEQVAASLRRIGRELASLPPGATQVRRRALLLAYDDLLQTACRELAIRHDLGAVLSQWDREVERLRVEVCLQDAGLQITARPGRAA